MKAGEPGMTRLEDLSGKIAAREARIGVIGLGYVGLPLALEFAKAGFRVTGFDLDAEKVRAINAGSSYIEDVAASEVARMVADGRLAAESSFTGLATMDVINVCVPTPLTKTKDPDVSFMLRAVEEIGRRLRSGQLVILGSTTYPGTTKELYVPHLEGSGLKCGVDFGIAFAPERIDPANKKFAVRQVPKVVGGETPLACELACQVFRHVFDTVVPVSSTQAAEMVKLLENTFRAINIGLVNEVALMCDRLGLDVWEVIDAAATKPYGFMKFTPGPGLGGHCIPVDPTYLSWKMKSLNFTARFIELATDVNGHMPEYVIEKITALLNEERQAVNGARILLLGVAYKADVSDVRESPALDIARGLHERGANVRYHDPLVAELRLDTHSQKSVDLTDEELSAADLVVILTDHSAIDYARVVRLAHRVYDTRNATRNVKEGRERVRKL
jgi:UDP-N-acetyl-D-glucosamine dehydrogenase